MFQYPVKGLRGQTLSRVDLRPGQGFPFDRVFGFACHDSGIDIENPAPMPKHQFLMLMRDGALAALDSHFESDSWQLTLSEDERVLHRADISTDEGRRKTEAFIGQWLALPSEHDPQLVHAAPHRFTDVSVVSADLMNAVSLINLNSVADLEKRCEHKIAPGRFRANVYFDGWPPFSELDLEGQDILIGKAQARVTLRTKRCAATEVDPITGQRDVPVPRLLKQHYGHTDMGIYAEIQSGAEIRRGDKVVLC